MDYRTRIISSLSEIGQSAWDHLVDMQENANPFLSFAFLDAMHESACASSATGWQPYYLTLWQEDVLAAALPLYVKSHSYGEYVFDWAWADAYQKNGLEYYPKLLSAIPFTPVSGPRLLARNETARQALVDTLITLQTNSNLSSTHILYPPQQQAEILQAAGFTLRSGVQFHWKNQGYRDFDEFLASLEQKKRKNIRAERRKVQDANITFRHMNGTNANATDWHFFYRCYANTYTNHHSSPYLTEEFFLRIGATMPKNILLVIAEKEGSAVAASLSIHSDKVLYGRYWGCIESIPCLHFETAYYQPLEFCIKKGIEWFEGGAQGEHKLARGFLPQKTWSAHWLAHPGFAEAVDRFLERESGGIELYISELNDHNPFLLGKKVNFT